MAAQVEMGLHSFVGLHVYVWPLGVVGTRFEQRYIERAEPLADRFEAVEVARVAVDDDPRGPQGAVAIEKTAAGEMLGRCRRERETVDFYSLPPVELTNLRCVDTPLNQPVAHTQRRQKHACRTGECEYRLAVQMVIVVVGQDHATQRRQISERDGRRMKAFWTKPLER